MPEDILQALINHSKKTVTEAYKREDHDVLTYWQEKVCAFLLTKMRHLAAVPEDVVSFDPCTP